jgi:hypothetical protein
MSVSAYSLCRCKDLEPQEIRMKYHKHSTLISASHFGSVIRYQALAICIVCVYIHDVAHSEDGGSRMLRNVSTIPMYQSTLSEVVIVAVCPMTSVVVFVSRVV